MKSDIISIAMGELQVAFDNEVMKAVQKVGVDVNKEELLKALELHHNLVRCSECKFSEVIQNDSSGVMARYCRAFTVPMMKSDDDYCSYGERIE